MVAGFDTDIAFSSHSAAVYGDFAGAVIGMLARYFAVYVMLLGAVLKMELAQSATNGTGTIIVTPELRRRAARVTSGKKSCELRVERARKPIAIR